MRDVILILQVILGIVLTVVILVQVKGTGFGRVWGASSTSFTRRGLEKLVFKATFVLTFVFILISVLLLII